ncbi:MAG: hypothetical protein KDA55_14350 [Planctomycetales bacterium]|nr:hypothetical protein [Planctomycetales bacterium]
MFLFAGIFFVIPFMMLLPTQISLRAAWRRRPRFVWRAAVCMSVAVALLTMALASLLSIGLDGPIPLRWFPAKYGDYATIFTLPMCQCYLINVALLAVMVCFPLSAITTFHTIRERRELAKAKGSTT